MASNSSTNNTDTKEDLSGRDRIAWNTLVSWASHLLLIVSGFIMPRMIDMQIGQVSLGIWDFCWSFINYLNIVGIGIGASVSRYVAKYRAESEIVKMQTLISSVALVQAGLALIVVIITSLFLALRLKQLKWKVVKHTLKNSWSNSISQLRDIKNLNWIL